MKTQIKRFLLTLGFMTRIPVNVNLGEVKDEDMHKGFLYYPVVGLIIGLIDMVVYLLVCLVLPEIYGIIFALLVRKKYTTVQRTRLLPCLKIKAQRF